MPKEILLKTNQEPQIPGNVKGGSGLSHVKLSMFEPGALQRGELDGLISKFYGPYARWLAAYTENSPEIRARESNRRERYLQRHPDVTKNNYIRDRKKRLEEIKAKARERINLHFRRAVAQRFGTDEADKLAEKAFVDASNAMNCVAEKVFPDSGVIALLNETTQQPISPACMIRDVVRPDFVPQLRQEILQRALLAHIAAELESRNSGMKARLKLAKIQAFLGEKLFDGKKGVTETIKVSGVYDNNTNEPKIVEGPGIGPIYPGDLDKDQHIKTTELTVRKIAGSRIRVHTGHNVKSPESSIIKAIRQAKKFGDASEGKPVLPSETVFDTHRILFAVHGGDKEVDLVYEKVRKLFADPKNQKHFADLNDADCPIKDDMGQIKGRVIKLDDRQPQKNDIAKSQGVKYKRLLVHFDSLSVPIEIKFQGMMDFFRDEFHIGRYNTTTGTYDGAAHDLYDIKRAMTVFPYFIPDSSIPQQFDLVGELRNTQEITAARLRANIKKVKKI